MVTHSSIFDWRIPWTEELVGYSPWDHKESDTPERLTLTNQSFNKAWGNLRVVNTLSIKEAELFSINRKTW